MPILPEDPEEGDSPAVRLRTAATKALTGGGSSALARVVALLLAAGVAVSMAPSPWAQVGIIALLLALVEVARKRTF
jgi:hypothetical protein